MAQRTDRLSLLVFSLASTPQSVLESGDLWQLQVGDEEKNSCTVVRMVTSV